MRLNNIAIDRVISKRKLYDPRIAVLTGALPNRAQRVGYFRGGVSSSGMTLLDAAGNNMRVTGVPCLLGNIAAYVTLGTLTPPSSGSLLARFENKGNTNTVHVSTGGVSPNRCYIGVTSGPRIGAGIGNLSIGSIYGTTVLKLDTVYESMVTWTGSWVTLRLREYDPEDGSWGEWTTEYSAAQNGTPGAGANGFLGAWTAGQSVFLGPMHCGKMMNSAGVVTNHWPLESGVGTFIEDIEGGVDGTLSSSAIWSTRSTGDFLALQRGYSLDHNGAGTGIAVANAAGVHYDDTPVAFNGGSFSAVLGLSNQDFYGLSSAYDSVALWASGTENNIGSLPANTADMTFVGDNGMAIYNTAQSSGDIAEIVNIIGALT